LITGSSRGFGRRLAEDVLTGGDNLVATAHNSEALADLAAAHGDRTLPFALDVTQPEQARAAIAAGVERFDRLDVVVNSRGFC
jgi:NAD(P)-dependent dehydrogenase (short-subunit alcohol dehydrogenase family)